MGKKIDDLRNKINCGRKPPQGGSGASPVQQSPRKLAGPEPERFLFACGHKVGVKQFTTRKCPACVAAERKRRRAENLQSRRSEMVSRKFPNKDGRLPHGARFALAYDAATETWTGTLHVGEAEEFTATAPAVFLLMQTLDGMYRKAVSRTADGTVSKASDFALPGGQSQ